MQDRFHPRTLLHELRRYGPEWAEKFPQVPDLLFQAADQIRQLDKVLPVLERNAGSEAQYQSTLRARRQGRWLGLGALVLATVIATPDTIDVLTHLPLASLVFGATGLYLLLRR